MSIDDSLDTNALQHDSCLQLNMNNSIVNALILLVLAFAPAAEASLLSRANGRMYYDTVQNITWLVDANYSRTSNHSLSGNMTWGEAMNWVDQLVAEGYSDWRLPKTVIPDPSCQSNGSFVTAENCIGSEMGNLFYATLGNTGPSESPIGFGLVNAGPFENFQMRGYWSATERDIDQFAWYFHFASGIQAYSNEADRHFALAVRDGDVDISEPTSTALLVLGLLVLIKPRRGKRFRRST